MWLVVNGVLSSNSGRLAILALFACAAGSVVCVLFLRRALATRREERLGWLVLASIASGTTVWSTHVFAVLDQTAQPVDSVTLLSMARFYALAWLGSGIALILGSWKSRRGTGIAGGEATSRSRTGTLALVGGSFIGATTAYMQTGGALSSGGFETSIFNALISIGGLISSAIFSALAFRTTNRARALCACLCLFVGFVSVHFCVLAASVLNAISAPASGRDAAELALSGLNRPTMAWLVGMLVCLPALFAGAIFTIDARIRMNGRKRLRNLADAAVEGILIVEEGVIVDVNSSFLTLSGYCERALIGRRIVDGLFRGYVLDNRPGSLGEYELATAFGTIVPVEIIRRIDKRDPQRRILAIRDLTERKAAKARLDHIAHHDLLTGLRNRQSLNERMAELMPDGAGPPRPFAVLSIDLDRFKEINDVFGQQAGDRLLAGFAWSLSKGLGETDHIFRFGGDQFIVVTTGPRDGGEPSSPTLRDHARQLADRLSTCLRSPIDIGSRILRSGGSIGISVFPEDSVDRDELLAKADIAMARAKVGTGGKICFFTAEMDSETRFNNALAHDMKDALEAGEFSLHYQLQANVATGRVTGMEALLRWTHKVHGPVSPSVFIPIAERTGFIVELGEWVLRDSCRTAASWDSNIRLAVNLSPIQFKQADLPAMVERILVETSFPASRLELEITESVLIGDKEGALATLRLLKDLGVTIALDDFCTGFSSLSMLQAFPFDKMKIDRSFLGEIDEATGEAKFLTAIFNLACSLDLAVLAEGVETHAHLAYLSKGRCDEAQGYLLQRPKPIEQLGVFTLAGANIADELRPSPSGPAVAIEAAA